MPSGENVVSRIWGGTTILVEIELRDPLLHLVSLYFERLAGDERIVVKDKYSGVVLSSEKLSPGEAPRYVKFMARGAIEVSITSPTSATLSGIFIDPAPEPAPMGVFEEMPPEILIPTRVPVALKADSDRIVGAELLMDEIPFASISGAPFATTITNPPPGRHSLSAKRR
jgi:hypothetical protein